MRQPDGPVAADADAGTDTAPLNLAAGTGRRVTPGRILAAVLIAGLAATAAAGYVLTRPPAARAAAPAPGPAKTLPGPPKAGSPQSAAPRPAPATTINASGSVRCSSGAPVEGVWLAGSNGGSGWADWVPSATAPQFAIFNRTIPAGEWAVHIGCGGSPASWAAAISSGWVPGTPHAFTCDDISGQDAFGTCSA